MSSPNHSRLMNLLAFLFLLLVPLLLFAQDQDGDGVKDQVVVAVEAVAVSVDWMVLLPFLINAVLVPVAVLLINSLLMPNLSAGAKQILALIAGPLLIPLAVWLSSLLGAPIDLTAIIIALGGAISALAGMGVYDVTKRVKSKVVVGRAA